MNVLHVTPCILSLQLTSHFSLNANSPSQTQQDPKLALRLTESQQRKEQGMSRGNVKITAETGSAIQERMRATVAHIAPGPV